MSQGGYRHHDSFELDVLAAIAAGASTADDIAVRLAETSARVQAALDWATSAGAVTRLDLPGGASYSLTPKGLEVVGVAQGVEGAVDATGHVDLEAAARLLMQQYAGARDVAAADALREQAGWPVDDAARDRVTASLSEAYARGALTKQQLDDRVASALAATTMGELRAAGAGLIDLPPMNPAGVSSATPGGLTVNEIHLNPALLKVRWSRVGWAAVLALAGVLLLFAQPIVGAAVLAIAVGVGLWTLRPLLASDSTRTEGRGDRS